jgi:hypothetical protein
MPAQGQSWPNYAHDSQHSSLTSVASEIPQVIRWSTPVDTDLQNFYGNLSLHYGSPLITASNTVLVPVKVGSQNPGGMGTIGFRIEGHRGTDGALIWKVTSDYRLPTSGWGWIPPWGPTLRASDGAVAFAAAGGTIYVRSNPDSATGSLTRIAFFGDANYGTNRTAFNQAIQICTPITGDSSGNLYFGYVSTGVPLPGYPHGIPGGLARVSSSGTGSFVSAASLSGNGNYSLMAYNSTPAISNDGSTVYAAVNQGYYTSGYLCRASSSTLNPLSRVLLVDPSTGGHAIVINDSTASPTVGPDGDVYFGVLEDNLPSHNDRGWLLHFDSTLGRAKTPGSFGWDDTASIVPRAAVPSYTGSSSYLVLTKYNNYAESGTGDGQNKLAVLDPNGTEPDPISGNTVMKEVITILGPTPNNGLPGVHEWCINSAAIDPVNKCAVVNSEDGNAYRWDFTTNTLSAPLNLAPPTGEPYTPTLIGPDGSVYAINDGALNCCVAR